MSYYPEALVPKRRRELLKARVERSLSPSPIMLQEDWRKLVRDLYRAFVRVKGRNRVIYAALRREDTSLAARLANFMHEPDEEALYAFAVRCAERPCLDDRGPCGQCDACVAKRALGEA